MVQIVIIIIIIIIIIIMNAITNSFKQTSSFPDLSPHPDVRAPVPSQDKQLQHAHLTGAVHVIEEPNGTDPTACRENGGLRQARSVIRLIR